MSVDAHGFKKAGGADSLVRAREWATPSWADLAGRLKVGRQVNVPVHGREGI